jgi:hypothetical protein
MNGNDEIIQLLTEIRDFQSEILSLNKGYLEHARDFNKKALGNIETTERNQEFFKSQNQRAISQSRKAVAAARWQLVLIGIAVITFIVAVFGGG